MVFDGQRKLNANNHPSDSWGSYAPASFESGWQKYWEETGIYHAQEASDSSKYYCLDFFPYPSGDGLHVGHCRNYVPTDVISRTMRMRGYNVLHPMGWDAFGEPAEQYAIAHGIHPRLATDRNTANFRRQLTMIGTGYDWSREIDSSQPEYYRWTQWIFLLLYQRGLAYRDLNWQWWCPTCQTTLSSHEVIGGVCWRGHSGVTKREIPAWYFKITAYADELLSGLDSIDWPENIKTMQRNWIGRSEGVEIYFPIADNSHGSNQFPQVTNIPVFTTRPDTLYGATFFVLAPEHPEVMSLTSAEHQAEVEAYKALAASRSEVERMMENREKTGVFTGGYVINPVNREALPVWIADYVLPGYGTGAIMGVPAHDGRDFEFARKHGLPVRVVIVASADVIPSSETPDQATSGDGFLVNSGEFNGLTNLDASQRISDRLEESQQGKRTVQYRMRDWLISRQRYWGTPIPIIHCEQCGILPVLEEELPVLLPDMVDFQPDGSGRSPLARIPEFVDTTCPKCGGSARRETDTMGGFACSSWYFLRFASPHYHQGAYDPQAVHYWMPVDLYVGGAEHAVLHLLYARFWTKVLADVGLVSFREPFARLISQGQMMGPDGQRMSKSRGNVVTPDSMVKAYGADALRLYEMFIAPFEQDVDWNPTGIAGTRRFLSRLWNLYSHTYATSANCQAEDSVLERRLHRTIQQVTERIHSLRFNTMVSALMEFVGYLLDVQRQEGSCTATYHATLDVLMVLIAPAAPHIAEELWHRTGHSRSVHQQPWPEWDPELAKVELAHIAVQVNGKLRQVIDAPVDIEQEEAVRLALTQEKVRTHIGNADAARVIYVPGKILNFVTGS